MRGKFSFSKIEIRDIVISALVLSYVFGGVEGFLPALLIVGSGFIFHELGHKFTAQHFGAWAEYRMWTMGLILAILSSFLGFIFAAPGAVYISPVVKGDFAFTVHRLTKKENGLISLAGPLVNFALGYVFLAVAFYGYGLFYYAARISFFLGLFNLLPIPPLDGSKILDWNWIVLAGMFLLGGAGYYLLAGL